MKDPHVFYYGFGAPAAPTISFLVPGGTRKLKIFTELKDFTQNLRSGGDPPTHRGGAKDPYQFLISREYSRKGILKGVSGGVTLSGTKATILEH